MEASQALDDLLNVIDDSLSGILDDKKSVNFIENKNKLLLLEKCK